MTLDETISLAVELRRKAEGTECQREYDQLIEWLEELKKYREKDSCQHKRLAKLGVCSDWDYVIYQDDVSLRYKGDRIEARANTESPACGLPHLCVCLDCGAVFVKELMPGQSDIRDRLNKQD